MKSSLSSLSQARSSQDTLVDSDSRQCEKTSLQSTIGSPECEGQRLDDLFPRVSGFLTGEYQKARHPVPLLKPTSSNYGGSWGSFNEERVLSNVVCGREPRHCRDLNDSDWGDCKEWKLGIERIHSEGRIDNVHSATSSPYEAPGMHVWRIHGVNGDEADTGTFTLQFGNLPRETPHQRSIRECLFFTKDACKFDISPPQDYRHLNHVDFDENSEFKVCFFHVLIIVSGADIVHLVT